MRTDAEIEELLNSRLPDGPGTSFEEGVQVALDWVLGFGDNPFA